MSEIVLIDMSYWGYTRLDFWRGSSTTHSKPLQILIFTGWQKKFPTSCFLFPLSGLRFAAALSDQSKSVLSHSGQPKSILHYPPFVFLIPVGGMCYSFRLPMEQQKVPHSHVLHPNFASVHVRRWLLTPLSRENKYTKKPRQPPPPSLPRWMHQCWLRQLHTWSSVC